MSFIKCIQARVNDGFISEGQAKTLEKEYNSLLKTYTKSMGDAVGAAKAANDMIVAKTETIAAKKKAQIMHALMVPKVNQRLDELKALQLEKGVVDFITGGRRSEGKRLALAIKDLIDQIDNRAESVSNRAFLVMRDAVEKNMSSYAGLKKNDQGFDKIVREILGESTGDPEAALFAKSIKDSLDYTHQRYVAAGGNIGKLENYYPQKHNKDLLKKTTFQKWFDFLTPKLDRNRMIDFQTGLPFTDARLKEVMQETYETIVTDGRNIADKARAEGKAIPRQGRDVFDKNSDSRFFHFKSADDFLDYNREFGEGDEGLFDMLLSHTQLMSRDTAAMEVLGPKPNAMMRHIQDRMEGTIEEVSNRDKSHINGMYDTFTGRVDGMASDHWVYSGLAKTRSLLRASKMGSAAISAMSDSTFAAMAAKFNGLPQMRVVGNYLNTLNPANKADREIARDLGYNLENLLNTSNAGSRFMSDENGIYKSMDKIGKFADASANVVIRASGLGQMTNMAKNSIGLEVSTFVAREAKKNTPWNKLPEMFRSSLLKHGINEADWKVIKKTPMMKTDSGVEYFRARDLVENPQASKSDADEYVNRTFEELINKRADLEAQESATNRIFEIRQELKQLNKEISSTKGKSKRAEISEAKLEGRLFEREKDIKKALNMVFSDEAQVAKRFSNHVDKLLKDVEKLESKKSINQREYASADRDMRKAVNLIFSGKDGEIAKGKFLFNLRKKNFEKAASIVRESTEELADKKEMINLLSSTVARGKKLSTLGSFLGREAENALKSIDKKLLNSIDNKKLLKEYAASKKQRVKDLEIELRPLFSEAKIKRNKSVAGGVKDEILTQRLQDIESRKNKLIEREKNLESEGASEASSLAFKRALELSNKFDSFVSAARMLASNEPTVRTKAITNGSMFLKDARRGTAMGEAVRSVMMFKTFPISVILNHLLPSMEMAVNKGRFGYLGTMAVGTTVLGGLVIQLREISQGKTPRDTEDPKFWAAAFLQGGGAGLFGDFLFGDYSRFGRSPLTDSLGPVVGLANDVMRTTNGNLYRGLLDDGDTNVGRDMFNLAKYNTPGANIWYSRLIMERLLFDSLEEMIDPKFQSRMNRLERTRARDFGQEYWWARGEKAPRGFD